MQQPVDHLRLRAADSEALIARVHRSDWPQADAETVAWGSRMYFYVVFALQTGTLNTKHLQSLLFGNPSTPSPEASLAPSPVDGEAARACPVLAADAEADATTNQAPRGESQKPARAQPKGGHRPGTGRLGVAAY